MEAFARVRVELAAARAAGLSFDTVWPVALNGLDKEDQLALTDTERAWRAAYLRGPMPSREVAHLLDVLRRESEAKPPHRQVVA